jgi:hypothetical protein
MATDPRGQRLKISSNLSGMSQVVLDNGPFRTITVHTRTEDLGALLGVDGAELVEHLMTRKPGHFRQKPRS